MAQFGYNNQQFNSPYYSNMNYSNLNSNGIIWVQGIEGAKAWSVNPNTNTVLFDRENDGIFYVKVSDNIGLCNIRMFKYEEIKPNTSQQQIDLTEYVKKTELESLINSMLGGGTSNEPIQRLDGNTTTK